MSKGWVLNILLHVPWLLMVVTVSQTSLVLMIITVLIIYPKESHLDGICIIFSLLLDCAYGFGEGGATR
jgi:hypothetical protein